MISYILRRLAWAVPTLLLLAALTFFFLRLAPGGPFDSDRVLPPEIMANLNRKYGLDLPLPAQFLIWAKQVLQGDLGTSVQYLDRPVTEMISETLPTSALLGALSLLFAVAVGIPLGCLAAWKKGTWLDWSAMFVAVSGMSLPSYLVASVLVLIFALGLGWFPPALWESPAHVILPLITLGTRPLAMIARLTRASLLEVLSADFIRTARAKGLSTQKVLFHHALRNSLVPVIVLLGPIAANLLTGSFLVETVFQIPGLGKHFVSAVINRDYNLVMGITLIYGVILVVSNLVTDLASAVADPRIRLT